MTTGAISSAYYVALSVGYTIALVGWFVINLWKPEIWRAHAEVQFQHPWREVLWALLAGIAMVAIGQLYAQGLLVPEIRPVKPLASSVNQVIIFSPFLLLLLIRRQSVATAWLPPRLPWLRLGIGMLLALCAITTFVLVRRPDSSLAEILPNVYHPKNLGYAVQVFFQDISIAIVLVRFKAAVGQKWFLVALVAVALLFSASHYPLKISQGLSYLSATREVLIDALLVSAVVYVLQRSRDILWFWPVHFAMDMMQFHGGGTS